MTVSLPLKLLQMEVSPEENGKYAAKTSPNVSAAGFSGSKVARLPVIRGHSQLNPSVASSMHMGSKKVKFMCSSSGKILPRPSDMKLRYVGGETRMVSLPRHMTYEAFSRKMVELYGPDIILKYQLPEEDLDALVSVSSDEDLENMMEECDRLSAGEGSSRLRAFVFLVSELNVQVLDEIANFKSSEQKFVDAVNAIFGDTLPAAHSTGKLYPTSDSFNDAYKAWNGIHSQDRDSFFSKNPYSEVFPMEEYISSGDLHTYESFVPGNLQSSTSPFSHSESFVPGNLQSSTSPFSHSAFMGQPVLSNVLEVPDIFKNDLVSVGWRDSPSFLGQGVGHGYGESHWVTSSEMVVPAQFTNDDSREDGIYEIEHSFGESSREDLGNVQIAQGYSKYIKKPDKISRMDEASAPDPAFPSASGGSPIKKLESGETSKHLAGQSQSDSLVLSPGALLQRQLMSSPSTVAPSPKNFNSDWPCSEVPIFVNIQAHSTMSGLENQPETYDKHVLQQQWERLSIDEPSFGLDRPNRMFGNTDDQSLSSVQLSTPAEISPISTVISAANFPVDTAPLSVSGWKLQSEKNHQNMLPGYASCITSMASISPQDSTALMVSSGQVSANVVSSAKPAGEIAKIDLPSIPVYSWRQETGNSNQILLTEEPYTVLSSQMTDKEDLVTDVDELKKSLHHVKGSGPSLITSDGRMVEPIGIQSDNHTNYFPVLVKDQQSLGSALPIETLLPIQLMTADVHQHKTNQADSFSKEEVSLPAMIDGSHKLDMLSELLSSARLTECSGETCSAAENYRSRSESLADEELHGKEGEKSSAVVRRESPLIANESLDFPIPTQDDFPSFQTTQNLLPSNDNCDKVVALAFATTLNDGNGIFANTSSLRNKETISNPHYSQVPAFTSLIQSWEATLLQDEDEHQKVEHVMPEHIQKPIDATPTVDKEIELEDSGVEFEEVQEFQLFKYGPLNAASIAEQEAKSRGLQIIRNSDLEELHELGSGTFGTVYHGKWRGTDVAIKRIKASCFSGRQAERDRLVADFWREACMLGQLHHPNVVAFYGVVPDGPGATLATVTEYMVNGSLKQVLQNKDRTLDRRKRLLIAMDAAFGMEYLHGKNVVHFDIKCENLLVNLRDTQRPICKVGDLGLSKVKQQTFVSGGVRGTLPWMAPELLNGSSTLVSEKVDIFSFGIVMWELLTGEEPYANMHYGAIIGGIVNNTLRPTVPRWCDPAWRSLMEKCWAADPKERPTFQEIARSLRAMEVSLAAKGPGQARILAMYK